MQLRVARPEVAVIPPQFGRSARRTKDQVRHSNIEQTETTSFVRESQHILNPGVMRTQCHADRPKMSANKLWWKTAPSGMKSSSACSDVRGTEKFSGSTALVATPACS